MSSFGHGHPSPDTPHTDGAASDTPMQPGPATPTGQPGMAASNGLAQTNIPHATPEAASERAISAHEPDTPGEPPAIMPAPHIIEAEQHASSTTQKYAAIVRTFENQYRHSAAPEPLQEEIDHDDSPAALALFIENIIKHKPISRATARIYRSAMIWHFEQLFLAGVLGASKAWEIIKAIDIDTINFDHHERTNPDEPRRQARRKSIGRHRADELIDILESGSGHGPRAAKWILATLASGLRPIEWLNTRTDDANRTLIVRSAKKPAKMPAIVRLKHASEIAGRPITSKFDADTIIFDKYGEIPDWHPQSEDRLIRLDAEPFADVLDHLETMREALAGGSTFKTYYDGCSKAIARACLKIPGEPHYSLYTFRHQFGSNIRAATSTAEAAILMGHELQHDGNQRTTRLYGKRVWAHRGGLRPPKPAQSPELDHPEQPGAQHSDRAPGDLAARPGTPGSSDA